MSLLIWYGFMDERSRAVKAEEMLKLNLDKQSKRKNISRVTAEVQNGI